MSKTRLVSLLFAVFAMAFVAGCGSDDSSSDESDGTTTAVTAADCTPENLNTYEDGVLTVGTDSPAYSPYFEDDDPTNGKGFESAVAYAIADRARIRPLDGRVDHGSVQRLVRARPEEVRLRRQPDLDHPGAREGRGLLDAVLHGLPGGAGRARAATSKASPASTSSRTPTSVSRSARPASRRSTTRSSPPPSRKVFDNSNDVVSALKTGQVDAIVVDLPQAIYLRDVDVSGSSVVGQFDAPGGDEWGALLAKDSELTECVDFALEELTEDGTLEEITRQWMSDAASAPELS